MTHGHKVSLWWLIIIGIAFLGFEHFATVPRSHADVTTGLVGWWKLDEDPAIHGTSVLDSSGFGLNGSFVTNNGSTNKSVTGKIGKAYNFDGTDDYITVPDSPSLRLNAGGRLSASFWIKASAVPTSRGILGKVNGNGDYLVWWDNGTAGKIESCLSSICATSNSTLHDNNWHHIVAIYDDVANEISLWVDTVKQTDTEVATPVGGTGPFTIGRINGSGGISYAPSIIDDVRIYNRALTASDVLELFNAANPDTTCSTIGINNFFACYYTSSTAGAFTSLVTTRTDNTINFDWGAGSPDASVPVDLFAARWTGNFTFNAGNHTFTGTADDGIRFYIDGALQTFDQGNGWKDQGPTTYTKTVNMTAGTHEIKVEYYENGWDAVAQFSWAVAPDTTAPSMPGDLAAVGVSTSQIDLSWTASTDDVGVVGYRIERCQGSGCSNFAFVTNVTGLSHNDTGLSAGTTYNYRVMAYDAASNQSSPATVGATTHSSDPAGGLVGWWKFDEASGTSLTDSSGNGNTGTLVNGAMRVPGLLGPYALYVDGVNDYADLGNGPTLQLTGAMTVSAWVKSPLDGSGYRFINKGGGGSDRGWDYQVFPPNGDSGIELALDAFTLKGYWSCTADGFPPNEWTHLAAVYRPSEEVALFKNGVKIMSEKTGIPASQRNSTVSVKAGYRTGSSSYFKGTIDDIRIYNRDLSSAEINNIYAEVAGSLPPPPPPAPEPAGNVFNWAWSETIGWISFSSDNQGGSTTYGVSVDPDCTTDVCELSGHAWSENIGWISFNAADVAGCPSGTCTATLNRVTGVVSGWARADSWKNTVCGEPIGWDGWIHLRNDSDGDGIVNNDTGAAAADYGVTVAGCNWDGWAWGGEVVGWIHFRDYGAPYGVEGTGNACSSAPTADIKADGGSGPSDGPITIPYNTAAELTWTSSGVSSCTVSPGGWTGTSGTQSTGNLTASQTYTLECTASGPISGLVAHWKFDETFGTTAFDSATADGAQNGTNIGATIGQTGKIGTAYYFDGINDYIVVNDDIGINPPNSWTVSSWFKVDGNSPVYSSGEAIISKHNYPSFQNFDYFLDYNLPEENMRCLYSNNGVYVTAEGPYFSVSHAVWHLAHCVYNEAAGTLSLYVDGSLVTSTATGGVEPPDTANKMFIGNTEGINNPFWGTIDDVRVYNRALSAAEVALIYSDGSQISDSVTVNISTSCGNGVIDAGEDCDGENLGGATCQSLGFVGGTLSCTSTCFYDLSQCTSPPNPQCSDGIDNDGDFLIDYPDDPGCVSPEDNSEENQCVDGLDNDGDGLIDEDDPGCHLDGNPENAGSYNPQGNLESNQIFMEI